LSIKRSIPNPISLVKDKEKAAEAAAAQHQHQQNSHHLHHHLSDNESPKQNTSISDSISATASSVSAAASSVFEKFENHLKSPFDFNNNNNSNHTHHSSSSSNENNVENRSSSNSLESRSHRASQKHRQSGRFFPKLEGPSISLPTTIFGHSLQDSDDNKSPEVFITNLEQQQQQQQQQQLNHTRHNSSNKYENSPTPRSSLSDMIEGNNSNRESESARHSLSGSGKP
jgi:hypothetical protein